MKKLINKIEVSMLRAKLAAVNFIAEERGDTNFISIAIILVIVIAVAGVFIGFKNKILGWLEESIEDLGNALGK